ncbi:MAG: hypothetical protein J6M39_06455 [Lachnospiraceae bacterium]|nr:hypothetical protein [Lachnospiraceae bacterium]
MIKKIFNIDNKWKVIVYYNIDYNLFEYIADDIRNLGVSDKSIYRIYKMMSSGRAKAVTISSLVKKCSIVGFNHAKSDYDLINSIAHEAVHVMEAILNYYKVDITGEPPAYTIGHLVQIMMQPLALI